MKKYAPVLLLALVFSLPLPGAAPADIRLYCVSLRFQKATARQFSLTYTLELTSIPSETGNGELAPLFDLSLPSHGSFFRLYDPILVEAILGSIAFDAPSFADANGNGFPDFFEVSQGVASVTTRGFFSTDIDAGTVTATWSRAAGSSTGTCKLRLAGATFGQLPDFTHTFELLEYSGRLNYTPTSVNVTGPISLAQSTNSTNKLAAALTFTKLATNRFNALELQPGAWTNAANQRLSNTNSVIERDLDFKTNYFGYVVFLDGEPGTAESDYTIWVLSIDDPNDANRNGIPDFSDDPVGPARRPRLGLRRSDGYWLLSISGEVGKVHDLDEIGALGQTNWIKTLSVTITNDPQNVALPLTGSDKKFWRVRVP